MEPGEHVLFWSEGRLYGAPDQQVEPPRAIRSPDFWPFELVEDGGEWLRVKPASGPGHCFDNPLSALEVELWVQRAQLHPVVRERSLVEHEDGTGQVLLPGVAVDPVGGWVHSQGFSAQAQLDPERVGLAYNPGAPLERPGLHSHLRGQELGTTATGAVRSRQEVSRVYGSFGEQGRILRDACTEHRLLSELPVDESPPLDQPIATGLPHAIAPAGVPVLLQDGTAVGTVTRDWTLGPRLPSAEGLWCEAWAGLALCFPEQQLRLPAD